MHFHQHHNSNMYQPGGDERCMNITTPQLQHDDSLQKSKDMCQLNDDGRCTNCIHHQCKNYDTPLQNNIDVNQLICEDKYPNNSIHQCQQDNDHQNGEDIHQQIDDESSTNNIIHQFHHIDSLQNNKNIYQQSGEELYNATSNTSDQQSQSRSIIDDTSKDTKMANLSVNGSLVHSDKTIHKDTENIAHMLKIIGDNLDTTTNDYLSTDIVLALRNIGDNIDTKMGFQNHNFLKATLRASNINIGQLIVGVLRPRHLVGTVLCTSLQFLLHYSRI